MSKVKGMPSTPSPAAYYEASARLGERVRALREAKDLTQEQLAERTGISRNQIQNIESNRSNHKGPDGQAARSNARLDTVFRLADALDVTVIYLLDPEAR